MFNARRWAFELFNDDKLRETFDFTIFALPSIDNASTALLTPARSTLGMIRGTVCLTSGRSTLAVERSD